MPFFLLSFSFRVCSFALFKKAKNSCNNPDIIFFDLQYKLKSFCVSELNLVPIICFNKEILFNVFIDEIIPSTIFIIKICLMFSLFPIFFKILIVPSINFSIALFFKSSSICNSFILSSFVKYLSNNSKQKNLSLLNSPLEYTSNLLFITSTFSTFNQSEKSLLLLLLSCVSLIFMHFSE